MIFDAYKCDTHHYSYRRHNSYKLLFLLPEDFQTFLSLRRMKSLFRFKKFEINQHGSTMKINTDGVLLGAMAHIDPTPRCILDIGTGTGVIALMLAQRFPTSTIDAVEIDEDAAQCALGNFQNSAFSSRLHLISGSFEEIKHADYYDWIVSNPPFYTNSLHNPDQRKRTARHTDIDFFNRLLQFAASSLTAHGELQMILPIALADEVIALAAEIGLSTTRMVSIRSYPQSAIIRKIIGLGKNATLLPEESDFTIYDQPQQHSDAYRTLLKPFFLAF